MLNQQKKGIKSSVQKYANHSSSIPTIFWLTCQSFFWSASTFALLAGRCSLQSA